MRDAVPDIDATLNGLCACLCGQQIPPDGPSEYFAEYDCQVRWHERNATNPGEVHRRQDAAGYPPRPARWRPDLVNVPSDEGLTPRGPHTLTWYTGRLNAQIFERNGTDTWHLRLDDGYRLVGDDIRGISDLSNTDLVARVERTWRRLERELTNPENTAPPEPVYNDALSAWANHRDDWLDMWAASSRQEWPAWSPSTRSPVTRLQGQPRAEVLGYPWKRRCRACNECQIPLEGDIVSAPLFGPATLENLTHTRCQVCPACAHPFPGPPLEPRVMRDAVAQRWRFELRAVGDGEDAEVRYIVADDHFHRYTRYPYPETYVEAAVQRVWDKIERAVLHRLGIEEDAPFRVAPRPRPAPQPDPTTRQGPGAGNLSANPGTRRLAEWAQFPIDTSAFLRAVAEYMEPILERLHNQVTPPGQPPSRHAGGLSDVQRQALEHRRNRNTGPPPPPLDPRRRGERR